MGKSEVEMVKDFYNCLAFIFWKEREHADKNGAVVPGNLKSAKDLQHFPRFPQGCNSLLMKHLTPDVFLKTHNQYVTGDMKTIGDCI